VNPDAYIVGEIWQPAPEWVAGDRFDAVMNYPLAEAILSFVGGSHLDLPLVAQAAEYGRHVHAIDGAGFARQLEIAMTTYSPETTSVQLNLLDSHDTPRFLSLAGGDATALRLAALIQMTLPGAPCVYYGDEVGLLGREDPDCRRAFPWDVARQDRELRSFIAGLTAMRRAHPAFRRGRFEVLAAEGSAIAYAMFDADTTMVVVANAGDSPARLEFGLPGPAGGSVEQVSWGGRGWRSTFAPRPLERGTLVVEIEAREGMVLGVHPAL
jgi:cyclomaltodextrinase